MTLLVAQVGSPLGMTTRAVLGTGEQVFGTLVLDDVMTTWRVSVKLDAVEFVFGAPHPTARESGLVPSPAGGVKDADDYPADLVTVPKLVTVDGWRLGA